MRIRYLLPDAYGQGGTARAVIDQANAMAEVGHRVELAGVTRDRDEPAYRIRPDVQVIDLIDRRDGGRPGPAGRGRWPRLGGRLGDGSLSEREERAVVDYVSTRTGGILVTTRPSLNLISARRTPKDVVRVAQDHLNLGDYPQAVRDKIARYYRRLDAVVVLTRANQEDYRRILPGAPIVRIPNAVHPAERARRERREPVVVAAGRLVTRKGFDLLIPAFGQAARRHSEWELRLFGTGPDRDRLAGLADDLGLAKNVTLMGHSDRLDEELEGASIYALSSRSEGLPLAMLEAMGHGLPVAAFDCPSGPREVLAHEVDGLLVPPGDTGGMATALERLMSDDGLRRRMGDAAAQTAGNYAAEVVMPLYEDLFAELLAREPIVDSYWTNR
ncbi:glycosyltransferase family 4 protein [Nonomuraea sediminis]|uniref:glycosyltransferase family 4 protein n=1 Tax=Nonomuraea sediminis TaxID=2835864 RepID=UPI001BDD6EBE|nr:glycosyltransferase family 4 protein [Nonomuraea sediminis]